eukprot:scaffold21268_cov86-Skeletonema_marinoi.AAC.4
MISSKVKVQGEVTRSLKLKSYVDYCLHALAGHLSVVLVSSIDVVRVLHRGIRFASRSLPTTWT